MRNTPRLLQHWGTVLPLTGVVLLALLCLSVSASAVAMAEEAFTFDLEEFEAKPFEWGGYAEFKTAYLNLNTDGALYHLNFIEDPQKDISRYTGALQLEVGYRKGSGSFRGVLNAKSVLDEQECSKSADVLEANVSLKPNPGTAFDLGKKLFRWGKGYAWNPIGFIDRPKDPNNPDEALEGYIGAGVDLVKSGGGPLQTVAFTSVALPVYDGINENFGDTGHMNFAAKLYLLYRDTDIDLAVFAGDSRTARYGIDFSRNLASNFEVHGEYAYVTHLERPYLDEAGTISLRERSVSKWLVGLRYLTENDITVIAEYYHNGAGYTNAEMDRFYELVDEACEQQSVSGGDTLFKAAKTLSRKGYAGAQAGRNYFYLKANQKEPFDMLYFTPGCIAIVNLDDGSCSISPELIYTGMTNWEFRLRYTRLVGRDLTEYGEKQNEYKIELRLRYYY